MCHFYVSSLLSLTLMFIYLAVSDPRWFPDQGWYLGPLHWEREILTTGPPRESPFVFDFK